MIQTAAPPTLDGLFRRLLARQPDALALADPFDKPRVTGQAPQRLTFAQADRAIAALAAHFIEAGLPANSVIAVQLPNTVEFVLTVLAAHRAGLVVALLPQLWRQAELTVALNRTGARAVVTMSRIDGVSHADLAMNAAVEAFSIRHVCSFGNDLPEGMVSLDDRDREGPAAAPRDAGWPQGGDDLIRRDGGRFSRGAAHPSQSDCRRPRDFPRKRRAAGRDHPVRIGAVVICGPHIVVGDLAAERRRAGAASPLRCRRAGTTDRRAGLRCPGCARATGLAAGRGRDAVADAGATPRDRALARAGTGGVVAGMAGRAGHADRPLSVWRSRSVWRPAGRTMARRT